MELESAGGDIRIYVYDNDQPGNESVYFTAHANGTYSCNYTFGGRQIRISRLGFIYLQQVLDGEATVPHASYYDDGLMLVSVSAPDAEILSADGISVDTLSTAKRIEPMPADTLDGTAYTEYWLPAGEYQVVTHNGNTVSVMVSDASETYRISLMPGVSGAVVNVGTHVEVSNISHGNITSYMDDGSTQLVPAITAASGELQVPGSSAGTTSFVVTSSSWFEEAVTSISSVGIVSGVGNNSYDPDGTLTVGMLIAILMRTQYGTLASDGAWYEAYMEQAYRDGIIAGTDGFQPDADVTHAQAALILTRYIEHYNPRWAKIRESSSPIDLDLVPVEYRNSVEKAYSWDLLHGDNIGNFNPNSFLTRAETAQMIYNYYTIVD